MKFGGASLRSSDSIKQAGNLLKTYRQDTVLIVVSAMGKTTNALERLSGLAQNRQEAGAWQVYEEVVAFHTSMARDLFPDLNHVIHEEVEAGCQKISRILQGILLLEDFPDRTYDRIVSYGEILSSQIVYRFLEQEGFPIYWKDARQLIRTDSDYRQAEVNWILTQNQIESQLRPLLKQQQWIITQGFIGSNGQGRTTTLGREGSDYSAAIFASCLQANAQIVWKDVPGIMNADPALDEKAQILPELGYNQIVEMSYYGASVIHPKTIRPLRNARIPLYVKSFLNPEAPGTVIREEVVPLTLSTKSIQRNQCLIQIRLKDFSFWQSTAIALFFRLLDKAGIEPRLSRISGQLLELVSNLEEAQHIEALIGKEEQYTFETLHGLELHAVLLANPEEGVPDDKTVNPSEVILFQQNSRSLFYLIKPITSE